MAYNIERAHLSDQWGGCREVSRRQRQGREHIQRGTHDGRGQEQKHVYCNTHTHRKGRDWTAVYGE